MEVGRLVREAADQRFVWVCSAASLKTVPGLGAALDGVKLVPAPLLGQNWWICSEFPRSLHGAKAMDPARDF